MEDCLTSSLKSKELCWNVPCLVWSSTKFAFLLIGNLNDDRYTTTGNIISGVPPTKKKKCNLLIQD